MADHNVRQIVRPRFCFSAYYRISIMKMRILPEGLQMYGGRIAVHGKLYIINNYKRCGGTGGVHRYLYKNVNGILRWYFNVGKMVAGYAVNIHAELRSYQMH